MKFQIQSLFSFTTHHYAAFLTTITFHLFSLLFIWNIRGKKTLLGDEHSLLAVTWTARKHERRKYHCASSFESGFTGAVSANDIERSLETLGVESMLSRTPLQSGTKRKRWLKPEYEASEDRGLSEGRDPETSSIPGWGAFRKRHPHEPKLFKGISELEAKHSAQRDLEVDERAQGGLRPCCNLANFRKLKQ